MHRSGGLCRGWIFVCSWLIFAVSGCGGGGGGDSGGAISQSQAITAQGAALAGEYVTYTVDASRTHFSYTIVESQYGLGGITRTGTLSSNADGTYTPSTDPNARVAFLPNGMLLGAIRESFGGTVKTVGFVGIQNPVTSFASAASIYDFVEYVCLPGVGCGIGGGTFKIDSTGNWTSCPSANYSLNCANQQSGTLNNLGNGRFDVLKAGLSIGNAVAYAAPNGQQAVIVDLKDASLSGLGVGILVGGSQKALGAADVAGRYVSISTTGHAFLVTVDPNLSYATSAGTSGTLLLNSPLAGMATATATTGQSATVVLAGTGLYGVIGIVGGIPYAELGIGF